ncbi:MAG: hypothetical protein ACRD43_07180 [Pyrinomonadaceae bacterium]
MRIFSRTQKSGAKFYYSVSADEFESVLEMPDGKNPDQNAWLTITANYTLNFVDSKNQLPGVTITQDGKFFAMDSNKTPVLFPISDWDVSSRSEFVKKFAKGESFWNYKFLLITPPDYDGFDYTTFSGPGWICRPNVICLFRLKSGGTPNHLAINVVRTGDEKFRSEMRLYDDQDVNHKTLWHELGHALDQLHIKALLGDPKCLVDTNADGCYVEPPGVPPNIQGSGIGLLPQNAKAWHELIAAHTGTSQLKWIVSMATGRTARKMPMGFDVRGVMPAKW